MSDNTRATGALRVGIVVDDGSLPNSCAHAFEQLHAAGVATIVGMLRVDDSTTPSLLWRWLDPIEDALSRRRNRAKWADSPLSALDAPARFDESNEPIDVGSRDALERWRRLSCDVIVRFAEAPPAYLAEADLASMVFDPALGGPPHAGLSEFVSDDLVTDLVLRTEFGPGGASQRATTETGSVVTRSASWNEHRRDVEAKAAIMLIDALRKLATEPVDSIPAGPVEAPGRSPRDRVDARIAARAALRTTRRTVMNRFGPRDEQLQWRLLLGRDVDVAALDPSSMTELVPPDGHFWADPFVVESPDGVPHIFFEDFDMATERGNISVGRLIGNRLDDITVVMEPDHHLSYPHVFEADGILYMVPESSEAGRVDLWRCDEFPARWELVRTLLDDVGAVDSTLLFRDGRWWLFTNLDRIGTRDFSHELHVYSSDDLVNGEFEPHPANPVVSDARHARMGGGLITTDRGELLRPAQAGARSYGSALHLMRVDELGPTTYGESPERTFRADWESELVGIHHLSTTSRIAVMDVCRLTPRESRLRRWSSQPIHQRSN